MEAKGQSYTAALWPHSRKNRLGIMGEIQLWSIFGNEKYYYLCQSLPMLLFSSHLKLSGEQQGCQGFAENLKVFIERNLKKS